MEPHKNMRFVRRKRNGFKIHLFDGEKCFCNAKYNPKTYAEAEYDNNQYHLCFECNYAFAKKHGQTYTDLMTAIHVFKQSRQDLKDYLALLDDPKKNRKEIREIFLTALDMEYCRHFSTAHFNGIR